MFGFFGKPREPIISPHIQNIQERDNLVLNLDGTIRAKVNSLSDEEVKILWNRFNQFVDGNGNLNDVVMLFISIIAPLLGLNPSSNAYAMFMIPISETFARIIETRFNEIINKTGVNLIDESILRRISDINGYQIVLAHIEESSKLMQNGFVYPSYSELMKAFEKLLKKMCLVYHREDYQKEFKEPPINAKMEDILKFLRKLGWNDRQYIKPIEVLNKFANDDKHAISHRGDINQVQSNDYNGVLNFILDWVESHR